MTITFLNFVKLIELWHVNTTFLYQVHIQPSCLMSKCDKTYQEPTAYTFISNYFLCFVSHCVSLFYRVNVESLLFSVASLVPRYFPLLCDGLLLLLLLLHVLQLLLRQVRPATPRRRLSAFKYRRRGKNRLLLLLSVRPQSQLMPCS